MRLFFLLLLIPISYLIYNWAAGEPIGEITQEPMAEN